MSLFTDALAGAGASAQSISGDMIAADLKDQLASKSDARQLTNSSTLQQQAAGIALHRDSFVNQLKMQSDAAANAGRVAGEKDLASFKVSPDQIAGQAALEGATTKAKSDATLLRLSPGEQVKNPVTGAIVAESDEPTMVDAYYDGTRQSGGGAASRQAIQDAKDAAAATKQRNDEFFKETDRKNFTDPSTGAVDSARWAAVTSLGKKQLDSDPNVVPSQAVAQASALYDKAAQFAEQITPQNRSLGHPFTGAKDPADTLKLTRQVVANIAGGMDPKRAFDPKTYDPSAATSAPAALPAPTASAAAAAPPTASAPSISATATAPVADGDIPPAPPMMLGGARGSVNPEYLKWRDRYGAAAQQVPIVANVRSLFDAASRLPGAAETPAVGD